MENKDPAFVIRLPRIDLKALLTPPLFLASTLILSFILFVYWYMVIHPVLWIKEARVEAFSSVLSSDTDGRLTSVIFEEGDRVERGQTLFALDREVLHARQKQLKAKVAALNEQLQNEKLRMEKAMQKYLSVSNELDFTVGSSETIQKNLTILEDAQIKAEAAGAQLSALQLDETILDAQLKKMKVEAPFEGIILKKWKNIGETVSVGEKVYSLFDSKKTWITADLPEVYLSKIAVGMPVKIRLTAYPQRELLGKIAAISPVTSDKKEFLVFSGQPQFVQLTLSIDSADLFLRPGLSASVGLKVR